MKKAIQKMKKALNLVARKIGFYLISNGVLPKSYFSILIRSVIDTLDANNERAFVLQIGAHDGFSSDPLNKYIVKYSLNAVLVEPQSDVFENLKNNYHGLQNLHFVNAAISHENGYTKIYRLAPSFYDKYQKLRKKRANPTCVSSLSYKQVENFLKKTIGYYFVNKDMSEYIISEKVKSLSLSTLISQYSISKIDILQIDTEGFDFEIIKMLLETTSIRPYLINYEHKNLSLEQHQRCNQMLSAQGYCLFEHGGDTVAFKSIKLS